MCGFCNVWVCVCVGFVKCVCVYVCVGGFFYVWMYVCVFVKRNMYAVTLRLP